MILQKIMFAFLFCIKGVKEAILVRGGIISPRPEGPRDYKRQSAKIAVHARNANIICCKIINQLNRP
jgi:hypothetical protein